MPTHLLTYTPSQQARIVTAHTAVTIGTDFERHLPVTVSNKEREGGFYILGEPRTGKSTLLVSMALQDIANGHGLLFIDPHYDAINNLLARIPKRRLQDVILLDPSDNTRSFALNVLHCPDPDNEIELDKAAGRVRDIFTKLWADERGELGIWLNKIITNAVHILLANPREGYTLADLPLLLTDDATLRNALLKNVKKTTVRHFWDQFHTLSKRDRVTQAGPAISRLDLLLADSRVRDIVGQSRSTIDFADILRTGKIVLLRRASNIDPTIKNLIGTIVLSEFLYAVYERANLPENERTYFGIYCDEFQEFATPDFAKLFTQTGKFGAMPVVAHQTREQFKSRDDPNRGATAASPNKVFFRLSPYDANEMPLVFAKEPPAETKLEEQVVISQNPVSGLLRGQHKDPEIRRFVTKYLRYLEDKREDIQADMEGAKFARMIELDTAAYYGAEAQEEGVIGGSHISSQLGAINARQSAILSAAMHSIKLVALQKHSNRLRVTLRALNRFLLEVMEGEKRAGQEAFSDFLIDLAAGYSALPVKSAAVLGLYIKLSYGDPNKARTIPFAFAQKYGLFYAAGAQLLKQAEIERKKEEDVRREMYVTRWEEDRNLRESIRRGRARDLWPRLMNYKMPFNRGFFTLEEDLLKPFLLMCARPSVQKMLAAYLTASFAGAWKEAYKKWNASVPRDVWERLEFVRNDDGRWHYNMPYSSRHKVHFAAPFLDSFKAFLEKYKEGGVVALALVHVAGYPPWATWDIKGMIGNEGYYPDFNVLYLPAIENRKPWEVLLFLEELTHALSDIRCETECAKFYESLDGTNPYHRKERETRDDGREIETDLDNLVKSGAQAGAVTRWMKERKELKEIKEVIGLNLWRKRLDIAQNKWWDRSPGLINDYLIARACDIVRFGKEVADVTFPQPDVNGATTKQVTEFVASLVEMVKHKEKYREWPGWVPQLVVPEHLDARVLSRAEAHAVREACLKELRASDIQSQKVARTINDFVRFCVLLAKPENHIKVKMGQYVEKQVRERTEIDMVNEAARLLSSVDPHTAYVRLEKKGGGTGTWTGKVLTRALVRVGADALAEAHAAIRPGLERRYTRPRERIRQEIEERQNAWWLRAASGRAGAPLPAGKRPSVSAARSGMEPPEPPPTRTRSRL
jgi:hypothetical protein